MKKNIEVLVDYAILLILVVFSFTMMFIAGIVIPTLLGIEGNAIMQYIVGGSMTALWIINTGYLISNFMKKYGY